MNSYERLRELASNLSWAWQPDIVELFRDLDPPLWRQVDHNPVTFLKQLPEKQIRENGAELALEARLTHAFHGQDDYLHARETWGHLRAGPLLAQPVAYFSAEFGLHESLPIYSGGLGVLSGDHLKAASDLNVPIIGVGLFYAKGYFNQKLNRDGWQQEHYLTTEVEDLPLEHAQDSEGQPLRIALPLRGGSHSLWVEAWIVHVGRSRLVLLDTNVPENDESDRALTARLYGGDNSVRVRQELVLGVGGMRALAAMGIEPSVLHLNEGHSAFSVLELSRMMMEREGRSFEQVREKVAARTVFTTHTPVEAGHDRFKPNLIEEAIGPLRDQLGVDHRALMSLGRADPNNREEPFCMTILGLKMSRARNAVSSLHARVSRAMWHHLWPGRSEDEAPIGHITNGVHVTSWLAAPMARLYNRYLGPDWLTRLEGPDLWEAVDRIDEVEFWEQHQLLRTQLMQYVRRCAEAQAQARDQTLDGTRIFDPHALTIGFARRFASYKRADLLLGDLDRLDRLVNDPDRPVQIIFAGKAHPADDWGKRAIQRVFEVTQDERFKGRIAFIENYNMSVVRHLVQGVDLWLNNPRRPLEACGTSGQKVILNGGLNLSILDGWWAEAYDGRNGFAIGRGDEHKDWHKQDEIDQQLLYEALEDEVVPLFYQRDSEGVPRGWVQREKHAIKSLAWRFSAQRMLIDYTLGCYLPAAGALTTSFVPPRAQSMRRVEG